jgi:hypothetical protein
MRRRLYIILMATLCMLGLASTAAMASPVRHTAEWHFPAPTGLTVTSVNSAGYDLTWNVVPAHDGQAPESYSVATYNSSNKRIEEFDVFNVFANLVELPAGTYRTEVWANGGPLAPPGAITPWIKVNGVTPTPPPTNAITPTWNSNITDLVFDDEFNGTSLNTSVWASSWFNGGVMNNVSTSPSNVSESGGVLSLKLSSDTVGALVNTDPTQVSGGGFQFGCGYSVEAHIFFPGNGANVDNWAGVWTDGQNWPADGETDIAETLGTLTSNYHSNEGANNSGTIAGNWGGSWHTYGFDREAGMNFIYWDGKLVRSYATDDGCSPQYLIMNVGTFGGSVINTPMYVDWIRVWKNNN